MNFVVKISGLLLIILLGCLAYALRAGDIATSGPVLFGSPWGIMTLVDLYVGFILFALFIISQETERRIAALWIAALLVLGNIVACIYLMVKLKNKSFKLSSAT